MNQHGRASQWDMKSILAQIKHILPSPTSRSPGTSNLQTYRFKLREIYKDMILNRDKYTAETLV